MKPLNLLQHLLIAATVGGTLLVSQAKAAVLSTNSSQSPTVITSLTLPEPNAGYDFFDATTDALSPATGTIPFPASFPSYATILQDAGQNATDDEATLTVNGTSITSGVAYKFGTGNLATIDFTGVNIPSSIKLGLLVGNSNDGFNNPVYTATLYSSSTVMDAATQLSQVTINSTATTDTDKSEFYFATATDVTAGDSIVISGAGTIPILGGVTLQATTPEPSTYALLSLGLASLIVVLRLRSSTKV